MSSRRKTAFTILIALAVLIFSLAVLVPRIADIDRYRPQVAEQLERASGRKIEIGRLELKVLPSITVHAHSVSVGNPPDFPDGHFLEIRAVEVSLDPLGLLHRRIVVRSVKLQDWNLSLIANSMGRWNTEMHTGRRADAERERHATNVRTVAWQSPQVSASTISSVSYADGRITVGSMLPGGGMGAPSFQADGVSGELHNVNPAALGIRIAQGIERRFNGAASPRSPLLWPTMRLIGWTVSDAQSFNLAQDGSAPQGVLAAQGVINVSSARFGAITASSIKSGVELYTDGVAARNIEMQLFGGRVTGDLLWTPTLRPPQYTTHLVLTGIDVQHALLNFPAASGKLTGALDGTIEVTGVTDPQIGSPDPLANLQGGGTLTVRNGTLPAIRLNRDLTMLIKNVVRTPTGSPDPSTFRSLSADFEIAQGDIRSRQIAIAGNGINLNVTGSVGLAGAGKLDYHGTGEIVARQGVGGLVAGLLGTKMQAGGKITFPFTLTGTLAAPHFDAPLSPILHQK